MKTYGAFARAVALMHDIDRWTEADWWDEDTKTLCMKDGRMFRAVGRDPERVEEMQA